MLKNGKKVTIISLKVKESQKQKGGSEGMRISDIIEEFIKDLFADDEEIEIQRNELAEQFNCVPSQINYVIATSTLNNEYVNEVQIAFISSPSFSSIKIQ